MKKIGERQVLLGIGIIVLVVTAILLIKAFSSNSKNSTNPNSHETEIIDVNPTPTSSVSTNTSIDFAKNDYKCRAGGTVVTYLNVPNIDNLSSSDDNIAEITKSKIQDLKCPCTKVEIKCKKEGTVKVTAIHGNEEITSNVSVTNASTDITIQMANKCKVGSYVHADIFVEGDHNSTLSFVSSNSNIASVATDSPLSKCINCHGFKIKCVKEGKVTLTATYGIFKKTIDLEVSK